MELALSLHNGTQVQVACDGRVSHVFALSTIPADENPATLGAALHRALFPPGSPACVALDSAERLALVLDKDLEVIPWEFLRDEAGFIALRMPLARLVPPGSRQLAPELSSTSLQVLAVPSNPVAREVPPLNIAGEWRRLREGVEKLSHQVRLERVNPPTLDSLRRLALTRPQAVIHFMGHGGQAAEGAVLYFENDAGGLQPISARDFALSLKKRAFLVTLNACVSAAPGKTEFSNLARLLVEKGLPYALGMSASIPDDAALTFSRALYAELASGVEVEEAVFQARRRLLRDEKRAWLLGVPVLYSSLAAPCASGFATSTGQPQVDEHQPRLEVFALPRAEGAFRGRVDELLTLGQALTNEPRPKLLTIHGVGGQGKTALAREAAERFAHAWPGGVWALSLENKPNRATFTFQLAQFLGIPTDNFPQQSDLERAILTRLNQQRLLVILDNAETFTEAVRADDSEALELTQFLREGLLGTSASLLVTSREPLGWPGEQALPLSGLSQREGAALFQQSASLRQNDIQLEHAKALSTCLDGHPLALLLLGLAFNETNISLEQFITEHETRLLNAENRYKAVDHRHRTLYASIETSVRYLDNAHKALLSGLWIFQSPYKPEIAAEIFTPPGLPEAEAKVQQKQIAERLQTLSRRGFLIREEETLADGKLILYRTSPTVRLFAQHYLEQVLPITTLQAQMGKTYAILLRNIDKEMNRSNWASSLVARCRADLEACAGWVDSAEQGWYANRLGWVLQHTGDRQAGMRWLEHALEHIQDSDQKLEWNILNIMAMVYRATGQPNKAIKLYEQILPMQQKAGNRSGEASVLNNMAGAYRAIGQPDKARELYEQAIPITREVGNQAGEAWGLNNLAGVYKTMGQPSQALKLYEQALSIHREEGNRASEATTLNNIAGVYSYTGQLDKALELYEQVLSTHREFGNRAMEAITLNNIAGMYSAIGQPGKAMVLYEQALPIARAVSDRAMEATILNGMAGVYDYTGQPDKALELYELALPIRRAVGDRSGEAVTLDSQAGVYRDTGKPIKALKLYKQALLIRCEVGDRSGEAATLNNMGWVYNDTDHQGKALKLYKQALLIQRKIGRRAEEATTLNNMGLVYSDIGEPEKALELYDQALPIHRKVGDRVGEATILNNMGLVYSNIGQPEKAMELYELALPIHREVGNRAMEATTLNNMGLVYSDIGQLEKAMELYELALPIHREVGNRAMEATTLINIAREFSDTGQPDKALELYEQALPIRHKIGDRSGEAVTCFNMALLLRDIGRTERAVRLLRQAVALENQVQDPDYSQDADLLARWESAISRGEPLPNDSL